MILLQIDSVRIFFSYRLVNTDKPNFVSYLVFAGAAALFPAKIFLSKHFESRPKTVNIQPRDIPSYRSQSERAKIAIH